MRIKKEFEELLNDRRKKLRFTIMDQRFYQETNIRLLSINMEKLADKISNIEAAMKQKVNWKGKGAIEEKVKLVREYEKAQKSYQEVMNVRKKLDDLAVLEKDYREYILYMEAYIGLRRWK